MAEWGPRILLLYHLHLTLEEVFAIMRALIIMLLPLLFLGAVNEKAAADGLAPGSCLLFPFYSTEAKTITIITVSNTGTTDVWLRVVWIDEEDCTPSDQWITLTALDTYTFVADTMVPSGESGFCYMYVVNQTGDDGEADADVLIGQETVIGYWDTQLVHFSLNPVIFQAKNVNPDGRLNLDGSEFTAAPRTLLFPRFFGQNDFFKSKMILLNLTADKNLSANAELLIYNDNEVAFSDYVSFSCWELRSLVDVSGATSDSFLKFTNHDPDEPRGFSDKTETGFIKMTGQGMLNQTNSQWIEEIGMYAVLIESIAFFGYGSANLPMQIDTASSAGKAQLGTPFVSNK